MTTDNTPDKPSRQPSRPSSARQKAAGGRQLYQAHDDLTGTLNQAAPPPARDRQKTKALAMAMAEFDDVMVMADQSSAEKTAQASRAAKRQKIRHQQTRPFRWLGPRIEDFMMEYRKQFLLATAASFSLLLVGVTVQLQTGTNPFARIGAGDAEQM
ncbi:MAG: hypothetical protein AAF213_08610, partial [Pseudomonadota bacterium]